MEGTNGYLSVVDWPLLPFYGLMCGLYVAMGLGWLVVCESKLNNYFPLKNRETKNFKHLYL